MNSLSYLGIAYDKKNLALNENVQKSPKLLSEFIISYLARCHRTDRYKKMYLNTLNHILKFCDLKGISQPYTNQVDSEFCEDFIFYLQDTCNHMQNTVKGNFERVVAMLQKAINYGYPVNNTYHEVYVEEEDVNTVYLDMTEITRIFYFKGITRFNEEVKDLFIVGCLTGLRYSDYSKLTEANFINHNTQIRIKTRKTGAVIQLPVHPFVRDIFEKYGNQMPKSRHIGYFNKAVKGICKTIGIDTPVNYERTVGTKIVRKTIPKWQQISSHTARRSFATNAFLSGIPPYRIMLITGHKSEKSFFKYVRITREENALTLSNHRFFQ